MRFSVLDLVLTLVCCSTAACRSAEHPPSESLHRAPPSVYFYENPPQHQRTTQPSAATQQCNPPQQQPPRAPAYQRRPANNRTYSPPLLQALRPPPSIASSLPRFRCGSPEILHPPRTPSVLCHYLRTACRCSTLPGPRPPNPSLALSQIPLPRAPPRTYRA